MKAFRAIRGAGWRPFIVCAALGAALFSGCRPHTGASVAPVASVAPLPPPEPRYAAETTVASVAVGGMTQEQAGHAVRLALQKLSGRSFTLRYSTHAYYRTWGEAGVAPDVDAMLAEAWKEAKVPLSVSVDEGQAKRSIRRAARALDVAPVAPRFAGDPGKSDIKPGKAGRKTDVYASSKLLVSTLEEDPKAKSVPLVVLPNEPGFSEADLATISMPVARYVTTFNPGQSDRSFNLRLVARRLNGALIKPGGVFSFNDWVGERRPEDGFRTAIVYKEGQMVQDTGGGLCQVSSTLYNVALLAGLPIVERSHHSLTVHYVPLGRDATVYWGQHDLQFRNNTAMPLYIRAVPGRASLTIEAWGSAPLSRQVRITSTSEWRSGKAFARVYRTVSENGKDRRELISEDTYSTEHRMASTGTSRNRRT